MPGSGGETQDRLPSNVGALLAAPPPLQAMRRELPDYLRPGLDVVFVGFNPGDRSSRIGHYYAGRGNQFWNFLFESGLAPERLRPEDDRRVLEFGLGLTDVVKRWSKSSNDLRTADYREGIPLLRAKLKEAAPRVEGARVFVLPSTSGRNGSLTRARKLAYFCSLARWMKRHGQ
ncbi:MAG: mismatch-specific DNA-glycosylase [Acidobacteria bacterium]|nr:MAG: mismatch-specific DNA-glycosylase [Acidobacteriota bacterium]